jgi:hypothetical protein
MVAFLGIPQHLNKDEYSRGGMIDASMRWGITGQFPYRMQTGIPFYFIAQSSTSITLAGDAEALWATYTWT